MVSCHKRNAFCLDAGILCSVVIDPDQRAALSLPRHRLGFFGKCTGTATSLAISWFLNNELKSQLICNLSELLL